MGQGWEWLAKDAQTRQGLWSDSFTAPERVGQNKSCRRITHVIEWARWQRSMVPHH